jgi:hypothetical protein
MRILLVTPMAPAARTGNRVTALRWVRMLRGLGHSVNLASAYGGQPCDVLVALHARKSAKSVQRFRGEHPDRPIVLTLTGTDLYDEIRTCRDARRSMELATRLVCFNLRALSNYRKIFVSERGSSSSQQNARSGLPHLTRAYSRCVCWPTYGP